MTFITSGQLLVHHLLHKGVLTSQQLVKALEIYDRRAFLPDEYRAYADFDAPIPIGFGQTNSQPYTVVFMLELLQVQPGDKILDIGSGSGWTTALLSYLTGPTGYVIGLERIPELVIFGQQNLARVHVRNAEIRLALPGVGLAGEYFDKILVSASASQYPQELREQLNPEGVLVLPVGTAIIQTIKDKKGKCKDVVFPGFTFVPLIQEPIGSKIVHETASNPDSFSTED